MEVYLDHAATTRPCDEAVAALKQTVQTIYGNPSSLHQAGLDALTALNQARGSIAAALSCEPGSIYFTSGATESNNLALFGIAGAYGKRRRKIVTTAVEHPSVEQACRQLEQQGFEVVRVLPNHRGVYEAEAFVDAVDENTCLLSMMLVNNETGAILPVRRAFYGAKKKCPDLITHCDAVQGFLKLPFRVSELQADLLSISGHKIRALKGIGALVIRKGIRVKPLLYGGKQEKEIRPGTESVPLAIAMGAAVKALYPTISQRAERTAMLKRYLLEQLGSMDYITVNSDADALPSIVNLSVAGLRSEILLHFLEQHEVYVSSGSACSKGVNSGVLQTFGATAAQADSAIRVSFSDENTQYDMKFLASLIQEAHETLIHAK